MYHLVRQFINTLCIFFCNVFLSILGGKIGWGTERVQNKVRLKIAWLAVFFFWSPVRHLFSGRPLEVCRNVIFWIQPTSLTCVLTTIRVPGFSHSKLPTVCSYDSCYLTWSTKTSIKTLLCVLLFSMSALEVKFRAAAGIFGVRGMGMTWHCSSNVFMSWIYTTKRHTRALIGWNTFALCLRAKCSVINQLH